MLLLAPREEVQVIKVEVYWEQEIMEALQPTCLIVLERCMTSG
jgi:hypothetical protein